MTSTASRSETDDDKWFFGNVSSEEAAQILCDAGGEEGTFLVRESQSSIGNFVLSFISNKKPVDILITKHWDDAFFSLITEPGYIMHGLDCLVWHYCQNPIAGPDSTILSSPCLGDPPPPHCRLHGASNLMHRAVAKGNINVVSELVKSGYRKLDAKNQYGQTALHISCIQNNEDIVHLLIKAGVSVDVRDQEGITPLQYCCRHNYSNLVQVLIQEGGANVQLRSPKSGEVALHEAASCGSLECVKALLANKSPSWPRSHLGQTPAYLARGHTHTEVYEMLVNHRPPIPQVRLPEYYQGKLSRQQAREILSDASNIRKSFLKVEKMKRDISRKQKDKEESIDISGSGQFILRKSSSKGSTFVLSLIDYEQDYHFEIQRKSRMYFIDEGPFFHSLEILVDHYSRFSDGLPCLLKEPVAPTDPLNDSEFIEIYTIDTNGNPLTPSSSPVEDRRPLLRITSASGEVFDSADMMCNQNHLELASSNNNLRASPRDKLLKAGSRDGLDLELDTFDLELSFSPGGGHTPLLSPSHSPHDFTSAPVPSKFSPSPVSPASTPINRSMENLLGSPLNPSKNIPKTLAQNENSFDSIDALKLRVGPPLGLGEFGSVLRGIWTCPSGDEIEVAVKTLHDQTPVNKHNFLREARLMMDLNHPYIVKLIGICNNTRMGTIAMVQELAPMGCLLNYLLDEPGKVRPDFHFKLWAAQIAEGMAYLEGKHFVHRDLAARNLLLASDTLVKISDFGLSRALGNLTDYYKASHGGKWPLKWYAPESIYYGHFTHASDVWSYGITLWEMYTYGDQPYGDLTGHQVADLLERNERLPSPTDCPKEAYNIMIKCWQQDPSKRPTFKELSIIFRGSKEYVDVKPYFMKTPS